MQAPILKKRNKSPTNTLSLSQIPIKKFFMETQEDIQKIKQYLHAGKILIVNMEHYFLQYQTNVMDLKEGIDKIKQIVSRLGGSLGRVGKHILIISPYPEIRVN